MEDDLASQMFSALQVATEDLSNEKQTPAPHWRCEYFEEQADGYDVRVY